MVEHKDRSTRKGFIKGGLKLLGGGLVALAIRKDTAAQQLPQTAETKSIPTGTELAPVYRLAILNLYPFTEKFRDIFMKADIQYQIPEPIGYYGGLSILNGAHSPKTNRLRIGSTNALMILAETSHRLFDPRNDSKVEMDLYGTANPNLMNQDFWRFVNSLSRFTSHPPDEYEPLRLYLREREFPKNPDGSPKINIQTVGWYDNAIHWGIMHLISHTGGNLDLLHPDIRVHFKDLLQVGDFRTWDQAISWYQGLTDEEKLMTTYYWPSLRRWVHIQQEQNKQLPPPLEGAKLSLSQRESLELLLKRFLIDFAAQFDRDILRPTTKHALGGNDETGYLLLSLELHSLFPNILKGHPLDNLLSFTSSLDPNSSDYQDKLNRIGKLPGAAILARGIWWGLHEKESQKVPFFSPLIPLKAQIDLMAMFLNEKQVDQIKTIIEKNKNLIDKITNPPKMPVKTPVEVEKTNPDTADNSLPNTDDLEGHLNSG